MEKVKIQKSKIQTKKGGKAELQKSALITKYNYKLE